MRKLFLILFLNSILLAQAQDNINNNKWFKSKLTLDDELDYPSCVLLGDNIHTGGWKKNGKR